MTPEQVVEQYSQLGMLVGFLFALAITLSTN